MLRSDYAALQFRLAPRSHALAVVADRNRLFKQLNQRRVFFGTQALLLRASWSPVISRFKLVSLAFCFQESEMFFLFRLTRGTPSRCAWIVRKGQSRRQYTCPNSETLLSWILPLQREWMI